MLVLILGLCTAPAAWASGSGNPEKQPTFLVSVEQWFQSALAEMASWFGVTCDKSSTSGDSSLDPFLVKGCDPPAKTNGGGGGGGGNDAGEATDPNGG